MILKWVFDKLGVELFVIVDNDDKGVDVVEMIDDQLFFDVEKYEWVLIVEQVQVWIDWIYECGYVVFDIEIMGLNEMIVDLVGILLVVEVGEVCYILLIYCVVVVDDLFGNDELVFD